MTEGKPSRRELYAYYEQKALHIDELRATYEHPNWYKRFFYQTRFHAVFDALSPQRGEKILDVGSGPGYYAQRIAATGSRVVCVDVSPHYLKQIWGSISAKTVADAEALPFRSAAFDKVLATEVLEHTLDPDTMLHEVARVLRPQGKAVVTSPSCVSYMDRLYEVKSQLLRYPFREHIQEFAPSAFRDLLSRHFHVRDIRFANCLVPYPFDGVVARLPRTIGHSIVSKLESSLSQGPRASTICWTIIGLVVRR